MAREAMGTSRGLTLSQVGLTRAVPDDVKDLRPARQFDLHQAFHLGKRLEGCLIEDHLRHGAAVHVHFFIAAATGLHLEVLRRKEAGDRGRSQQDLLKEFQGLRMAAGGNGPHVPDHQALGIELRGADEKPPPLLMLPGDGLEHGRINILGDQSGQGAGVGRDLPPRHGD